MPLNQAFAVLLGVYIPCIVMAYVACWSELNYPDLLSKTASRAEK